MCKANHKISVTLYNSSQSSNRITIAAENGLKSSCKRIEISSNSNEGLGSQQREAKEGFGSQKTEAKEGFGVIRAAVPPPPVVHRLRPTTGASAIDEDEEGAATPAGYLISSEKYLPALTQKAHPIVEKVCDRLKKRNCRQLLKDLAKLTNRELNYICLEDSGPCGSRIFVYAVKFGDRIFAEATEISKLEAQEKAARFAVEFLIREKTFDWPDFDCSFFYQEIHRG